MKNIAKLLSLLLCFCLLFTACGKNGGGSASGGETPTGEPNNSQKPFNVPTDLMSTEEYHSEINKLLSGTNFTTATKEQLSSIDKLGDRLKDSIIYSTNDITECTGTKYYVSNSGNDENDGKTPETAWATLEKLNNTAFKSGDLVLFERGSLWRGTLRAASGVTYSAYGSGHKPEIRSSINGMQGEWVETDKENIWTYQLEKTVSDIGTVVFNFNTETESYLDKADKPDKMVKNTFAYCGLGNGFIKNAERDYKVYAYCEGNPQKVYDGIEISLRPDPVEFGADAHDIVLNNLALNFGGNPYFASEAANLKNITMSYCVSYWCGGVYQEGETRLGGGSGCWKVCDNLVYDHCYFYQQFDSGVTPQYDGSGDTPAIMKNFITKDCLFEYCEYTLEYFNTQKTTTENRFENLYFGYNFCRYGGQGFGDKPKRSAYVKSWDHENSCYDSKIEYNIFDRPFERSIEVIGYEQSADGNTRSYDRIPKLQNNVYIGIKNRTYAEVNKIKYKFNEASYKSLNDLGVDLGSVFIYSK